MALVGGRPGLDCVMLEAPVVLRRLPVMVIAAAVWSDQMGQIGADFVKD